MDQNQISFDETDKAILRNLQIDSRMPLGKIAKELKLPKSTVHYRTKRMEEAGVIEGYFAKLNSMLLGEDYITVTFVRAKYGPDYHDKIGGMLSQIPGTTALYFVFGEYDFIIVIRSKNREDFLHKLERMTNMTEIERTITQVVAKVLRDDPTVDANSLKASPPDVRGESTWVLLS